MSTPALTLMWDGSSVWQVDDTDAATANAALVLVDDQPWMVTPDEFWVTSTAKTIPGQVLLAEWAGSTGDVQDGVLRVKGPLTRCSIVGADGTGLSFEHTLSAAQYAFIDVTGFRAWRGGASDWEPTSTQVLLDWPAAGPLRLSPTATGIPLTVTGEGMTSASTVTLRGRKWWL